MRIGGKGQKEMEMGRESGGGDTEREVGERVSARGREGGGKKKRKGGRQTEADKCTTDRKTNRLTKEA